MKSIGEAILDEIIKEDLVWAETEGVCVWKANSHEILEAIASRHCEALLRMKTGQMWSEETGGNAS